MNKINTVYKAFKKWFYYKKGTVNAWYLYQKNMLSLRWHNAPKEQLYLTKGAYYIRKGAVYQVGQPVVAYKPHSKKKKTMYIKNMFFNFNQNKITASYSNKPIEGLTEQFKNVSSR
ncbi:hypothetical protein PL373_01270 [Tenacibaculum maritimum]|nr:hypothetical protein [Tenacibaculum maritimum]MDB0599802.1 hypothetical protein [Tenacibaculum maritimum]MDB0610912.1 hypothetical protein [Tenacibaculum maritimum]